MDSTTDVQVTAEDIRGGIEGHTSDCPIARAVTRTLQQDIEVGERIYVEAGEDGPQAIYHMSPALHAWIRNFDRTGNGVPIVIRLDHRAWTAVIVGE